MNLESQFLEFSNDYESHLPMLLLALQISQGDVVELGCGAGSTMLLRRWCAKNKRYFVSFDNDEDWALQMNSIFLLDWESEAWQQPCGLLFIDHSPGEHRAEALRLMAAKAQVVVIHDSEEGGLGAYNLDFSMYRFRLNFNRIGIGAGTTIASNTIDVTQYAGDFHGYKFEK